MASLPKSPSPETMITATFFTRRSVGACTGPGEGSPCFSFVLVFRALRAPREPLVLLVKKAKEEPAESLAVLGPSAPLEKE